MRACKVALVFLFVCSGLFADAGVKLQWMPRAGDRYTLKYTDSVITTGRANGQPLNSHLDASMEGEIDIASASDTDGAIGAIHLRTLSASTSKGDVHKEVSLSEKDLKSLPIPFKLDQLGRLAVESSDLEQVAAGVDLAAHFAGLFFSLPEDQLQKSRHVKLDRGSFELDIAYKSDRNEASDLIVVLDGEAKTKMGQMSQANRAFGHMTMEFDVTKGYMRLLNEDFDTKTTQGENKLEVHLQRKIEITRISGGK